MSCCVQAEDGIRDGHVTGVQTCALPIWGNHGFVIDRDPRRFINALRCQTLPGACWYVIATLFLVTHENLLSLASRLKRYPVLPECDHRPHDQQTACYQYQNVFPHHVAWAAVVATRNH